MSVRWWIPYSGEELMAFPAIHPDIAVLHALRTDPDGNTEIGNNKGIDEELALTAKTVIVTAEEIVPEFNQSGYCRSLDRCRRSLAQRHRTHFLPPALSPGWPGSHGLHRSSQRS